METTAKFEVLQEGQELVNLEKYEICMLLFPVEKSFIFQRMFDVCFCYDLILVTPIRVVLSTFYCIPEWKKTRDRGKDNRLAIKSAFCTSLWCFSTLCWFPAICFSYCYRESRVNDYSSLVEQNVSLTWCETMTKAPGRELQFCGFGGIPRQWQIQHFPDGGANPKR